MHVDKAGLRARLSVAHSTRCTGPDLTGMGDNGIMIINKLYLAGVVEMG